MCVIIIVVQVHQFLKEFQEVSDAAEGAKYPTLATVIPLYNAVIDHCEDWVDQVHGVTSTAEKIREGARNAKEKILEYYNKVSVCLSYAICLL